jgi:hypothetical protein
MLRTVLAIASVGAVLSLVSAGDAGAVSWQSAGSALSGRATPSGSGHRVVANVAHVGSAPRISPRQITTTLPTSGFGGVSNLIVDPATGDIFVPIPQEIVVMSPDAHLIATLPEAGSVEGLALNQGVLYALFTLPGQGSASDVSDVVAINAQTLQYERTVVSAPFLTGISLVYAGGYLWTAAACDCGGTADPTRIDPTTGALTFSQVALNGPRLFAAPDDPSDFFASWGGNGPNAADPGITRVTIASGVASVAATQTGLPNYLGVASVSTDDRTVIAGDADGLVELTAGDLEPTGITHTFPGVAHPDPTAVVASTAGGAVVATNAFSQSLSVFSEGVEQGYLGQLPYDLQTTGSTPRLALSSDLRQVYAVGEALNGSADQFTVDELGVTASPAAVNFEYQRVGTYGYGQRITLTNVSPTPMVVGSLELAGADSDDFFGTTTCGSGSSFILEPGHACQVELYFSPTAIGGRSAVLGADVGGVFDSFTQLSGSGTEGYVIAGAQGEVGNFGDAAFQGDMASTTLNAPIVGLAATPNGDGYWLLGRDGGIFTFGNASFFGSTGGLRLNEPVVGIAPTPDGGGYWLVASDGGIFTFGDAPFLDDQFQGVLSGRRR